jgi:putative SOS response-associated peptidase YedK
MVVILHEHQYNAWLDAPPERSMDFMQQYPAELLVAVAAPIPSMAKRAGPRP